MVFYRYLFYFLNFMNMPISKLSDEYYERKYYLKTNTVPTQSVMRKKMTPALANVYFKSMIPKYQVLAGLAPPMKGGGSDWIMSPQERLKGRVVLKPIKKEHLSKLSFCGLTQLGDEIIKNHKKKQNQIMEKEIKTRDDHWKDLIKAKCSQHKQTFGQKVDLRITNSMERAFHQFCFLYSTSLTKLEEVLLAAAMKEIQRVKTDTHQYMQTRYVTMFEQQAARLYDHHNARLLRKTGKIKTDFVKELNETQELFENEIHEINVEKHMVIEKLRNFLECQNLACQVYVALKEKEECSKEIKEMKHKHQKERKLLTEQLLLNDFEIKLAKEKEKKRREVQKQWNKKICEVVKKFQLFVSYSLHELPEYAEFFINAEKLLLLQLDEVLENPDVESIFQFEKTDSFDTPIPRPHPYFLFCDKTYKPNIDDRLCPKHCTSSASQFPVVVVNKRCIYAACDNFKTFTDKVTQYVHGKRGDDKDFEDDQDYTISVPIKCTPSDQIQQIKLESSLQQLLQNEWANIRNLPLECCSCRIPFCFCSHLKASPMPSVSSAVSTTTLESLPSGNKITGRAEELKHDREPKWKSYMDYVKSKKCKCSKMSKHHLEEHLPPYMTQTSKYEAPELPNYEMCDLETLRKLVREVQGKRPPPPPTHAQPEPKTKDAETQYSDLNFEFICACFSDEELDNFFKDLAIDAESAKEAQCKVVTGSISPSYLDHSTHSFVTRRTHSLKQLLDTSPELEEIFMRKDCNFNSHSNLK